MASLSDKNSGYDILQQIIEVFLYFHTCFSSYISIHMQNIDTYSHLNISHYRLSFPFPSISTTMCQCICNHSLSLLVVYFSAHRRRQESSPENTFTEQKNTFTVTENTFTGPLIARVQWPIHMLIDPKAIILMHTTPYCNLSDYIQSLYHRL